MMRSSMCRMLSARSIVLEQTSGMRTLSTVAASTNETQQTVQFPEQSTDSKRTGVLALKVGMLGLFDKWGQKVPCTVLHIDNCQVVQVKTDDTDGYTSVQLGVGEAKLKNVNKPLLHHYKTAGVEPKRKLMEFRVTRDAILPVGTYLNAKHFVPGQLVDVCGTTKGKGFQGAMKRHGFGGGRASHGNSLSHRVHGSTGATQDPGRVWKGKKMAGRMGGERVTMQNLWVFKIDPFKNLIYVKGQVPGNKGTWVRVTDAVKGPHWPSPPPFPTHVMVEGEDMSEMYAPSGDVDVLKPVEPEDPY